MARDNFIGGAWKPARSGATDPVIDPATGAQLDEVASSDAADVDDAVAAAAAAFGAWSATTPRQRFEMLSKVADAIEADLPTLQDLEVRNVGKPLSIIDFEMDLTVDNWRFFAAGARFLEGRAGRVHGRPHLVHAARSDRRDRVDRAVELPAQHGDVEGRPRARGRQHRGAEALGADTAQRAAAGRDHGRHPAAGCAQRRHRRRRARGRVAREASRCRDGVAHRRRRDRTGNRAPPPTRSSACTSSWAARRR